MQPRAIPQNFSFIKELLKEETTKSPLNQLVKLLDILLQKNEKLVHDKVLNKLYKQLKEIQDYPPACFDLYGHDEYEECFIKLIKIKNKFDEIVDDKTLTLSLIVDYISFIDPPSATTTQKNGIFVSDSESESDEESGDLVRAFRAQKKNDRLKQATKAEAKLEHSKQQNGVDKDIELNDSDDEALHDKMESIVNNAVNSFIPVQPDSKVSYGELSKEDAQTLASGARPKEDTQTLASVARPRRRFNAPRLPDPFDKDMEAAIQASLQLQSQPQQGGAANFGYPANKEQLIKEKMQASDNGVAQRRWSPPRVDEQYFDNELALAMEASLQSQPSERKLSSLLLDSNKSPSMDRKDSVKLQSPVKSKLDSDLERAIQASLKMQEEEKKLQNFSIYTIQDILDLFARVKAKTQEIDSKQVSLLDQIQNLSRQEVTKTLACGNYDAQLRKTILLDDFREAKKVVIDFNLGSIIESQTKDPKTDILQNKYNEIVGAHTREVIAKLNFDKFQSDISFYFHILNLFLLRDKDNILKLLAKILIDSPKTKLLELQEVIDGKNSWEPLNYILMLNFAYRVYDYDDMQKVLCLCLYSLAEKENLTQNQDKVLNDLFNDPKTEFDFKWKGKTALRIAVERNNVAFLTKLLQINEASHEMKRNKENLEYRYIALDGTDEDDKEVLDFILADPIKYISSLKVVVKMQAQYDKLVESKKGDFLTSDIPSKVLKAILLQYQKQQKVSNNNLSLDNINPALSILDSNDLNAYEKAISSLSSPFAIAKESTNKYWTISSITKLMQELFPHRTKLNNNAASQNPYSLNYSGATQQPSQRPGELTQQKVLR